MFCSLRFSNFWGEGERTEEMIGKRMGSIFNHHSFIVLFKNSRFKRYLKLPGVVLHHSLQKLAKNIMWINRKKPIRWAYSGKKVYWKGLFRIDPLNGHFTCPSKFLSHVGLGHYKQYWKVFKIPLKWDDSFDSSKLYYWF